MGEIFVESLAQDMSLIGLVRGSPRARLKALASSYVSGQGVCVPCPMTEGCPSGKLLEARSTSLAELTSGDGAAVVDDAGASPKSMGELDPRGHELRAGSEPVNLGVDCSVPDAADKPWPGEFNERPSLTHRFPGSA